MATDDKGLPELGRELVDMTVAYAKQETIQPLKELTGYLAKGVAGAAIVAVGLAFFLLGVLRLVQAEGGEHLDGYWSWVPYLVCLLVAAGAAYLAISKILKGDRS
jgi:hypothetical protein